LITIGALALTQILCIPAAEAASINAYAEVCSGYYGYVENPRLACAQGTLGSGGGVIMGGSGVGRGINVPFTVDSYNSEFSATAAALQDYGVFKGYAAVHVVDQHPDIFGGVYRAQAIGEQDETWTITGGTGLGYLNLAFGVTGSAHTNVFVSGGNGTEGGDAYLVISIYMATSGEPSQSATTDLIRTGGTYAARPAGSGDLTFIFGVPFQLKVSSIVSAGGGYDRFNPPDFFGVDSTAAFHHTSVLSGVGVKDAFGNPVDFTLTTDSGTRYPISAPIDASAVPEPGTLALFGLGSIVLSIVLRRRQASDVS
jgi:hypothetical protein